MALSECLCTHSCYGELIITPGGVVGGLTRGGWWSLPVSHHPPQGVDSVIIDRWLDDACAHISGTGWGRGHHWQVTVRRIKSSVPLPGRRQWQMLCWQQVQQMADRTAALAAGDPVGGPALLPAWVWWLWTLDRVRLPVADALGVVEYSTAHEKGGPPSLATRGAALRSI